MFQEHSNCIWGTRCQCGSHVYILQNHFHPWVNTDFIAQIPCTACKRMAEVDVQRASEYYNQRILSKFSDLHGTVLDLGCGGGFLTKHVLGLPGVTRVIALDSDPDCKDNIADLADSRVEFVQADAASLGEMFPANSIDYLISRDVFMFIKDTDKFFTDIAKVIRGGIRQMGWYQASNPRMNNLLTPDEIKATLVSLGWKVELELLDWYKSGYHLRADK